VSWYHNSTSTSSTYTYYLSDDKPIANYKPKPKKKVEPIKQFEPVYFDIKDLWL